MTSQGPGRIYCADMPGETPEERAQEAWTRAKAAADANGVFPIVTLEPVDYDYAGIREIFSNLNVDTNGAKT